MKKLYKKIFALHKKKLRNTSKNHSHRIIISFSGVPGSGKTHLSKLIEKRYGAVRIPKDDIRDILNHQLQPEEIVSEKDMTFFKQNFPRWKRDYDSFNKQHKTNIVFKKDTKKLFLELDNLLNNAQSSSKIIS